MTPTEERVLDFLLDSGPSTPEDIAKGRDLLESNVVLALILLEADGIVGHTDGGHYAARPLPVLVP